MLSPGVHHARCTTWVLLMHVRVPRLRGFPRFKFLSAEFSFPAQYFSQTRFRGIRKNCWVLSTVLLVPVKLPLPLFMLYETTLSLYHKLFEISRRSVFVGSGRISLCDDSLHVARYDNFVFLNQSFFVVFMHVSCYACSLQVFTMLLAQLGHFSFYALMIHLMLFELHDGRFLAILCCRSRTIYCGIPFITRKLKIH